MRSTPIDAAPPNLHDEMCGEHRKKPAAEDEDDDAGGENASAETISAQFSALLSSLSAPTPKGAALLSDRRRGDADRGLYRTDAHAG